MDKDKIIPESELILNADGSVYHLKIKPEHLANSVILVGDPGRVKMVSSGFDSLEFQGRNREFIVHTGSYRSKRITVMSTGMGTDNIDIVLNELDALVNIDLETRQIKPKLTSLNLFRLGTSGSLQPDLPLNTPVLSAFGLGLDGMLWFYDYQETKREQAIREAFLAHSVWEASLPVPYLAEASPELIKLFEQEDLRRGITATAPGFYGPQGRRLRLPLAFPNINDRLQSFTHEQLQILNYEMETSALYGLSRLLGHRALTICLSIANRYKRVINKDYHPAMEKLIKMVLNRIAELKD